MSTLPYCFIARKIQGTRGAGDRAHVYLRSLLVVVGPVYAVHFVDHVDLVFFAREELNQ